MAEKCDNCYASKRFLQENEILQDTLREGKHLYRVMVMVFPVAGDCCTGIRARVIHPYADIVISEAICIQSENDMPHDSENPNLADINIIEQMAVNTAIKRAIDCGFIKKEEK